MNYIFKKNYKEKRQAILVCPYGFRNIMVNLIEINNEKEYVVATPDRKQATLLNLLGIEMNCKHGRKQGSLKKQDVNIT